MRSFLFVLGIGMALLSGSLVSAHASTRPDGHAPMGVMGDHMHNRGEWMVAYRFMDMSMEDSRNGTSPVSTSDVLADYMVAPLKMNMQMHMFGLMLAPWQRCTLMFMTSQVKKSMDLQTRAGVRFTTKSSGIGDLSATALLRLYDSTTGHLQATVGASLPTGSIDKKGDTPMAADSQLPYPMQLGSGTVDPILALTWVTHYERWSWGAQGKTRLRMGTNDRDYHLGNHYQATGWGALVLRRWLSVSGRLALSRQENIDGADPDLQPQMVPTADPLARAGTRLEGAVGVNGRVPEGTLRKLRVAVELIAPLVQDLDGPQLETKWTLFTGLQYDGTW
jgi:hypothetical protein